MNIVYASNDAYVPFLGISLFSLLENNKQLNKISIFILSDKKIGKFLIAWPFNIREKLNTLT